MYIILLRHWEKYQADCQPIGLTNWKESDPHHNINSTQESTNQQWDKFWYTTITVLAKPLYKYFVYNAHSLNRLYT